MPRGVYPGNKGPKVARLTLICKGCGIEFQVLPKNRNRQFHDIKCQTKYFGALRKGQKLSADTRQKMSDSWIGKIKKPLTEEHCNNISKGLTKHYENPENCLKVSRRVQALHDDPNTRDQMRKGLEVLHTPEVEAKSTESRRKQLLTAKDGNNFTGGKGRPPNQLMLEYAKILVPLGYLMDEVIISRGKGSGTGSWYLLDFALPDQKINIEIDGSSHNQRKRMQRDFIRDTYLRSLGWKIVRIKEY